MDPDLTAPSAGAGDEETMVVSKSRLRQFLADQDSLRAERDGAAGELAEVRSELEALQAHLEGTLAENVRLRERLSARGAGPDPRQGPQDATAA